MSKEPIAVAIDDNRGGFLKKLEKVGNKIPNPAVLFLFLLVALAFASWGMNVMGAQSINPKSHELIYIKSLISADGLSWFLTTMVKNYVDFPPMGMILVLTLGLGTASESGFMGTAIRTSIHSIPPRYITFAIVLISFTSHIASDAAIVIVPPLAAMVFYSLGRHPFVGFACSVAAIYSGFTANILIVTTDVLLSGITTQAVRILDPVLTVTPLDNWYFMSFAVIYLSILTTVITEKFVEPRLGPYDPLHAQDAHIEDIKPEEKKALRAAGFAALAYIAVILLLTVPEHALLRNPQDGAILGSPFMKGIVPLLCGFLFVIGFAYGKSVGSIKSVDDVIHMMTTAIKGLGGFMVMAFFIAQFIAAFTWTNMATFIATSGAEFLQNVGMTGLPALICFMLFGQFMGLFMASGSAIWALLSPVFVPMFMLLGYHPAFIQVAFRAGDGAFNSIAIVNPWLPLFLEVLRKYKKDAGIGTYLSLMMPYAMAFLVMWYVLFIFWYWMGWPTGPGVPQRLW